MVASDLGKVTDLFMVEFASESEISRENHINNDRGCIMKLNQNIKYNIKIYIPMFVDCVLLLNNSV